MLDSVSVAEGKYRVRFFREGQGPPLVFLHGELGYVNPDDSQFLQTLSNRFTVYAPLHPGYGESEGLEEIEDVQDLALHYFDLLDALSLDQPLLIGHSMGGMVAAEMATLCPHRASKMVLITPLGLWHDDHPIPDFFVIPRDELRQRLFSRPDSDVALQVLPNEFPSMEAEMAYWQGLSAAVKLLWGLPYNPKLMKRLQRITTPTLIIWGRNDGLVHPAYGEMFNERIKGSRMVVLPSCAHMPHLERPEELLEEVSRFLTRPNATVS